MISETVYATSYNGVITDNVPLAFAELTSDTVLDALESLGLYTDGRMLALNSYENRVYQIGMEESAPLVVKFYRPGRWSDAAIVEEHAFVHELVEQEIPVVPPMALEGRGTLNRFKGFAFALFPRQGGVRLSWTIAPRWSGWSRWCRTCECCCPANGPIWCGS